jgi:hypothetical protein
MEEETGFRREDIELDATFCFTETYFPTYKRFAGEQVQKDLVMFLGKLKNNKELFLTEHAGYSVSAPSFAIYIHSFEVVGLETSAFHSKKHCGPTIKSCL